MTRTMSRRSLLRGAGAALALPWLEATSFAPPAREAPRRLAWIHVPMGVHLEAWTPKGEGAEFELGPTLEPLQALKSEILVFSGLDHRRDDQAGNPHPRGSGTWLSSGPVGKLDSAGFCTDVSVDQLAARGIGQESRLASLELACQRGLGKHASNISWRGPGAPTGTEVNPKLVFLRMFGDPKGDALRHSVVDHVLEDAGGLARDLGKADRQKLDEYLEAVRAVERQIQAIERDKAKGHMPKVDMPDASPADFPSRLRLMSDLLVLAFQTDTTRVATLIYGLENGAGVGGGGYRHLGVNEDHHSLTHWDKATRAESTRKIALVDRFHVQELAYLLEKLRSLREGDGTLLDRCLIAYGSGIQQGHRHNWDSVPTLLAGRGGGRVKPGRHLRYGNGGDAGPGGSRSTGVPLANLWRSMLDAAGVRVGALADSTGPLERLS
jgi:hypothetical protein